MILGHRIVFGFAKSYPVAVVGTAPTLPGLSKVWLSLTWPRVLLIKGTRKGYSKRIFGQSSRKVIEKARKHCC